MGALALLLLYGLFAGDLPANAAAPVPGDSCTIDGALRFTATSSTPGYLLACNGTSWASLLSYNVAGGNIGISTNGATCTTSIKGSFRYNTTSNYMEYCNGSAWRPFDSAGCAGPTSCPIIGNTCSDGTVFAGCNAATFKQVFVTACDAGQTLSGSTCSGTRLTKTWNNGNVLGYVTTNATSLVDGVGNTATLIAMDADSVTSGFQNHQAAA
jgi:hypothetical protein